MALELGGVGWSKGGWGVKAGELCWAFGAVDPVVT